MSSLLTEALSLYNLAAVGIFGIVLSAAFCEIEWTRRHKLLLVGCTILMLALQGVVSLRWGTGLARYLYPLITHLPLWLLLAVGVAALARRALAPRLTTARAESLALPMFGGYALLGAVLLFQHYFIGPVYTVYLS